MFLRDLVRRRRLSAEPLGTSVSAPSGCGFPPHSEFAGTIKNGQIILDFPASLPEGTRVEVLPIEGTRPALGMREEDWPTTPEGIAGLLARMDQVDPGWLSPEDDAAWRAAIRAQKEFEKTRFFEDAEKLRRVWE